MPGAEIQVAEIAGMVVGAVLTLLVFSYLFGDLPLLRPLLQFTYRLVLHLFIGALVGYSFGIAVRDVSAKVLGQLAEKDYSVVVPLIFGILLLIKGFPRYAYIGNFSIAYLVGVGTAVALGGALLGTLVPQIGAAGRAFSPDSLGLLSLARGLLILFGTICTLMAFNFALTAQERQGLAGALTQLGRALAWVGRVFLIFALGVAFAGALTASLSIFIGRVQYLLKVIEEIGLLGS